MATLTEPDIASDGAPPIFPNVPTHGGGGGGNEGGPNPGSSSTAVIGIVVLMCASVMTFSALVSAMVVRRGLNGSDWHRITVPSILWWNTGILLISSVAFDLARRTITKDAQRFKYLWTAGSAMGLCFLTGQAVAWQQLADEGLFLQGSLSSAFFYVLTWAHAAHVVGALVGVGVVEYRALRGTLGPSGKTWATVSAVFWHFLDVLWLGLMALFVFWA